MTLENPVKSRETLLSLISVIVEKAAKGAVRIDVIPESVRLLSQHPDCQMSLGAVQGEIARRAIQWGVAVDFDPIAVETD